LGKAWLAKVSQDRLFVRRGDVMISEAAGLASLNLQLALMLHLVEQGVISSDDALLIATRASTTLLSSEALSDELKSAANSALIGATKVWGRSQPKN
jgi:hypothetical protein